MKKLSEILRIPEQTIKGYYVAGAIIIYAGLILAAYFFLLHPQKKQFRELISKESHLNELYFQVINANVEKILSTLQSEITYMDSVKRNFEQRCLSSSNISQVLNDLTKIISKNKLQVISIDPILSRALLFSNYSKASFSIHVKGSYNQLLQMLQDFKKLPYWVLIEKISISGQQSVQNDIELVVFTIVK